jgi:hypothetical protein
MAKPRTDWQPLPHDPIQKLAENLWWVRAPVPGISINRTMTLVRLADGRLVIFNGVALDEAAMKEIEGWGTPAFLIIPGAGHRLDGGAFKRRYPGLKVFGPIGARKAIEQAISLDGVLQDFPGDAQVSFQAVAGIKDKEGAMLVKSSDGTTVVVNDIIFNMELPKDPFGRLIVKMLGSAPGVRVSRIVKLFYCDDKPAFRAELEKLSKIPDLVRLIVGHDSVAHGPEARAALESAAQQLS